MQERLTISREEFDSLFELFNAVKELPFGESVALPWCRESFPKLDSAMKSITVLRGDEE